MSDDYLVNLDVFRGPLDLLLYLVKREELDVRDIPIARVTAQFQKYLDVLQVIDVERVGDFLVMAATLMEIKTRMLLPRPEEHAEAAEDPRQELVRQLLEYKRYKDAAAALEARAEEQAQRLPRLPPPPPRAAAVLRPVELWDLVSAFGRLMRETLAAQAQTVADDFTPLHVYVEQIRRRLARDGRVAFSDLFTPPYSRGRLVGLFLAVLELAKQKWLAPEQAEPFGDIVLVRQPDAPEPPAASDQSDQAGGGGATTVTGS